MSTGVTFDFEQDGDFYRFDIQENSDKDVLAVTVDLDDLKRLQEAVNQAIDDVCVLETKRLETRRHEASQRIKELNAEKEALLKQMDDDWAQISLLKEKRGG